MPIFVFGQLFIEVVLQISDIIHISCLSKMYQLVILVCSKVFAVSQIFFSPILMMLSFTLYLLGL